MEQKRRKLDRLVRALDELVETEATSVEAGDLADLPEVQQRAGAIVDAIGESDPAVVDAATRARVAGLLARRQHTIELLESQLATAREELHALHMSANRAARLAPVYGSNIGGASRFRAVG